MPVKRDESGRRYVQAEAQVPGTPEQVWDAIATGHGISSWFVPTELDGREGGRIVMHFSPDGTMDSSATITEWDAPRRMVATSQDAPNGPEIATEWTVEARAGGTCTVRVVHSWFASTDDWDQQFEGHEMGWFSFFRILRLYLEHFTGQRGAAFQLMGTSPLDARGAWQSVLRSLGIESATTAARVISSSDVVSFAGTVEHAGPPQFPELLLRLDAPAPALVHMFAMPMGGTTYLPVRAYFFGGDATNVAAREEPRWQAWMAGLAATPA